MARTSIIHVLACCFAFSIIHSADALEDPRCKGEELLSGFRLVPKGAIPFVTGNKLIELCETGDEPACIAYVVGVWDGLESAPDTESDCICLPHGATTVQLSRLVTKWLREHPDDLHLPATFSIGRALRDTFPCSKSRDPDK